MRVIKKSHEKQITCWNCSAVLLYANSDVFMKNDDRYYITCPCCGKDLLVFKD